MWEKKNSYQSLIGRHEKIRPPGRPGQKWRNSINVYFRGANGKVLDSTECMSHSTVFNGRRIPVFTEKG